MSSKRRVSELYQNTIQNSRNDNRTEDLNFADGGDYSNDQSLYKSVHLDTKEHDQLIDEYEIKIKQLSARNENLVSENKEYLNRIAKLSHENTNLIEK